MRTCKFAILLMCAGCQTVPESPPKVRLDQPSTPAPNALVPVSSKDGNFSIGAPDKWVPVDKTHPYFAAWFELYEKANPTAAEGMMAGSNVDGLELVLVEADQKRISDKAITNLNVIPVQPFIVDQKNLDEARAGASGSLGLPKPAEGEIVELACGKALHLWAEVPGTVSFEWYIVTNKERAYSATFTYLPERSKELKPKFRKMAESIKLAEPAKG